MIVGVNTNAAAMVALRTLNRTEQDLSEAQRRVTTGLKVASVKDNGALWSIAQGQRASLQGYDVVRQSLQRGIAAVETAMGGAEQILDLLYQMRDLTLPAGLPHISAAERATLNADFVTLRERIAKVARSTSFNGINMIKGGPTASTVGKTLRVLAGPEGSSTITVEAQNLALYHGSLNPNALMPLNFNGDISSLLRAFFMRRDLDDSIEAVVGAVSALGTGAKALEMHLGLVGKMQDSLAAGIGALVDADLAKESARIEAIGARRQLGFQALGMANSGPRMMLALFR